jgi:hypothetical protein
MISTSSRTFVHNYPNNPTIEAALISNLKKYKKTYTILSLGHYPENPIFTH